MNANTTVLKHAIPEMAEPWLYDLLEASASQARTSARLLVQGAEEGNFSPAALAETVQANATIITEIRAHLLRAIVVSLPKGEVDNLAGVLAEIPADAARLAERFALAPSELKKLDWESSLYWIEELSEILVDMVRQLRGFESLDHIKELHARMLTVADHAETHADEMLTQLYKSPGAPLHLMLARDLNAQLNANIERYRAASKIMVKISFAFF